MLCCGSGFTESGSVKRSGSSISSESGHGSRVLMTKNWRKKSWKFFKIFFWSKIAIYLSPSLHILRPRNRRRRQPSNKNIKYLKRWNLLTVLHFSGSFLPSWIRIRIQGPYWIRIHNTGINKTFWIGINLWFLKGLSSKIRKSVKVSRYGTPWQEHEQYVLKKLYFLLRGWSVLATPLPMSPIYDFWGMSGFEPLPT